MKFKTLFFSLLLVFFFIGRSEAKKTLLTKIILKDSPSCIKLFATRKMPYKIIKIDDKEILIALSNINVSQKLKVIKDKQNSIIKKIAFKSLQGRVVGIAVTGKNSLGTVTSKWDNSSLNLVIKFKNKNSIISEKTIIAKTNRKKKRSQKKKKLNTYSLSSKSLKSQKKYKYNAKKQNTLNKKRKKKKSKNNLYAYSSLVNQKKDKKKFSGDNTDLLLTIDVSKCSQEIIKAFKFLKKGLWKNGFDILNIYITQSHEDCLEQAKFLRAYAFFKLSNKDNYKHMLEAADFFHELLIIYPESELASFGYAFLGIINSILKNNVTAKGFFNIVKNDYENYPGLPEIFYYLGKIYNEKGSYNKSLKYFRKVFEQMPKNAYTVDAGIGVGKALFKKKRYSDSLSILSHIVKLNPEKIYDSSKILLYIGNASLELDKTVAARKNLIKVYNLFPEINNKDIILSSIGDTYAVEGKIKKAVNIYKFVINNFPTGEGGLKSYIGLAKYSKDNEEKEKIYNMFKKDFPDHRFAQTSSVEIAKIYYKNRKYIQCIDELKKLSPVTNRDLRIESLKLMQKSYESLFNNQFRTNFYTKILAKYEKERVFLDKMESREIFLNVGLSYIKAGLYEQGFNQLIKAYKQYPRASMPSELVFGLGVAMDETERNNDALEVLDDFVKRFSNNNTSNAYFRMGEIFSQSNRFDKAINNFTKAYKSTKNYHEKGNILIKQAGVYKNQNKLGTVSFALAKAVKNFTIAPGNNYNLISDTYKRLGESYIEQKKYSNAAEAFKKSLEFSDTPKSKTDVRFMLADAYQRGNSLKKAKEIFEKIAVEDDSVWSKLSKERLSTLDLAKRIKSF